MKALVTGGAGFIGSHLVDRLIDSGIETKVFVSGFRSRNHPPIVNKNARILSGDLRDYGSLVSATKDVDVVFHIGGIVSHYCVKYPELAIDVNIKGTWNLKEACVANNVKRIIYASSSFVYGDPARTDLRYNCKESLRRAVEDIGRIKQGQSPLYYTNWTAAPSEDMNPYREQGINEECLMNPKDLLGVTKLSGEKIIQSIHPHKIDYTILRLFNVYGGRQYPDKYYTSVLSTWIRKALNGESLEIHDDGTQSLDFTYVEDFADAFVLSMDGKAKNEIFNVGSGTSITMNELAKLVNKLTKNENQPHYNTGHPMFLKSIRADINKIHSILGWKPKTGIEDGLMKTIRTIQKGESK